MDRLHDCVWRGGQKTVDVVRARYRFGLSAPVAFELGPDAGEGSERSFLIEREPDDALFLGLRVRLWRVKLLNGTRQRLSGFSQPRQCGDVVFLMLVTGGPPSFGGGGMPQRIIVSSRSIPVLSTTGAG